jgi:predicted flavoprotein YhiN
MTKREFLIITERLSNWQLHIKRSRSFKKSMVTAGGVSMYEVNPKTTESLKVKVLFLLMKY